MATTPFEVLGVRPGAPLREVRRAYRRRAAAAHPDAGGGAREFRRVSWAYDALRDPARRAAWERRCRGTSWQGAPPAAAAAAALLAGDVAWSWRVRLSAVWRRRLRRGWGAWCAAWLAGIDVGVPLAVAAVAASVAATRHAGPPEG